MSATPSHTVSVVSSKPFDWGPLFLGTYSFIGLQLLFMFALLAGLFPPLSEDWLIFVSCLLIVSVMAAVFFGWPYRITAHLTLHADRVDVEWRNGRHMEFPLTDLEQLVVRIGSAAGDGESVVSEYNQTRITQLGSAGLDNYLDLVSEWGGYAFKFRLDKEDMAPLNACLYAWTQQAVNLRIEDRSGRAIPYRVD